VQLCALAEENRHSMTANVKKSLGLSGCRDREIRSFSGTIFDDTESFNSSSGTDPEKNLGGRYKNIRIGIPL